MPRRTDAPAMCLFLILLLTNARTPAHPQSPSRADAQPSTSDRDADQTATILNLTPLVVKLQAVQSKRACDAVASPEELSLRQQTLEVVQAANLDVDSVLAELSNERGELSDLRAGLQARRDQTVAKLNSAALITGSAVSAGVSATQFTTLPGKVQNTGDAVGIGAGAASTILSILASKRQAGPSGSVGEVPNMLAPLFDRKPVLHTYYAPPVLQYLQSIPPGAEQGGTRLDVLIAQWTEAGRLDAAKSTKREHQIVAYTSSDDKEVKISIADLTNRVAMLQDVAGRLSLMKRDLAVLMHSYLPGENLCRTPSETHP